METLINSVISELETFEASVLAPFFQDPNTVIGIMIAIGAFGLFYSPSDNTKKLFDNLTYRLIWVLLIVLATIYSPIIGLLTAMCYLMFLKKSKETFSNSYASAEISANIEDEPISFAQEQLEILESNENQTHLQRVIEKSKQVM
jgi:hypothetical protein